MNRLITNNPREVRPEQLPPARREGPLRVLFLTSDALGFRTLTRQFESYTAGRDDVDAVHVRISLPAVLGPLRKAWVALRGWDFSGFRLIWLWSRYLPRVLRTTLPAERFDCAVVTTQGMARGMASVKARTGLPYAVYLDTTVVQYVRDLGGARFGEAACIGAERKTFRDADVVAGMSRWSLESVRDDYGIPESKLLVVHNAVPVAQTLPRAPSAVGRPPRLVIVGNGWVRKGGDRLLGWHQKLWKDRAELHVIGADVPVDKSLAGVVWHGAVEHGRLMDELLPSMDVFVLPTRMDMSPWAVIEAAGRGLPVVSSRVGAIHEIVEHGRTGFLCRADRDEEYIQAIETLMADVPLREAMGRAAHVHMLAEFTPETCYGALIERLKEVVAARDTPRRA